MDKFELNLDVGGAIRAIREWFQPNYKGRIEAEAKWLKAQGKIAALEVSLEFAKKESEGWPARYDHLMNEAQKWYGKAVAENERFNRDSKNMVHFMEAFSYYDG